MAWICKKRSVIASGLVVAVSLFVVVVNFSEKPRFLLPPMLSQGFVSRWSFSRQPHEASRAGHPGYVSVPKQEPLKLQCDVCSVVSSSGQILGRRAGPEIERASCVWRMNNAPTRGFEHDVGHRTDLRVVSHTSVPLLAQKPQHFFGRGGNDTAYVVWGPLRNMRGDGKGVVYNMLRQAAENYPHARIYITTEERMNHCDKVFKRETGKDSTGLCECWQLHQCWEGWWKNILTSGRRRGAEQAPQLWLEDDVQSPKQFQTNITFVFLFFNPRE